MAAGAEPGEAGAGCSWACGQQHARYPDPLTGAGNADAIAAHRPRDADAFARRQPSRSAPMPAGAVLVLGTGPYMPVTLPAAGSLAGSITRVAASTRQRKTPPRATSVTLPGPLFQLLASTGLLRWFASRQRLVHSFAASLRGPTQPLTLAGAPLRAEIPVATTVGNVPVTLAALSYAGTLRLTVLARPGGIQVTRRRPRHRRAAHGSQRCDGRPATAGLRQRGAQATAPASPASITPNTASPA